MGEIKQKVDMIVIVGLEINDSISKALRTFFDTFKYAELNKGDSFLNPYKDFEGKYFKDEGQFILYNKSKGNYDLTNIAVDDSEIKMFLKICKEYGVDVLYMQRPENLEELFHKSQRGEPLSDNQQKIVDAFVIKDSNGEPRLKSDASLICFNVKDFDVMERVLDKLEDRNMNIAIRKERAQKIINKMKENKEHKEKKKEKDYSKEVK